jgi:hypothetical protein
LFANETKINAALGDPKMKVRFAALGAERMPRTPTDFGKFIADETEKWGKVIRGSQHQAGLIRATADDIP